MRVYSQQIANAIKKVLKDNDWSFVFDEEYGVITFNLSSRDNVVKRLSYIMIIHDDNYTVYSTSKVVVDPKESSRMAEIAEYVCRANYGLRAGNFEFDFHEGTIRFKYFVDCEGLEPSKEIILNSIFIPAAVIAKYEKGIIEILFSDISAIEAIQICEKGE